MITIEEIKQKIKGAISEADVIVEDLRGDQKHYGVDVISPAFEGKTTIQQHQMIYDALGSSMKENIHALRIKTSVK